MEKDPCGVADLSGRDEPAVAVAACRSFATKSSIGCPVEVPDGCVARHREQESQSAAMNVRRVAGGVRAWDSVAVGDGADLSGGAVVPKALLALRS